MQMYLVGGAVRDELLGVTSKDYDYTVVLDAGDIEYQKMFPVGDGTPFTYMVHTLTQMGFKIFLETPEFLTVRAQFPRVKNMTNTVRVLDRITEGLTFGLGYKP